MKKLITLLALFASTAIFAQAPQGFNYQATVRNSSGALIVNQNVYFKFNVMLNSATSVPVFTETHYVPTDNLGQVNLVIGQGTATVGTFSTINWGTGNYYLGIEINTGSGYVAMGTTQLLSVPYALYANSSGNAQAATPNLAAVLAVNNGANNLKISNLANPTQAQDAATKNYVDNVASATTTLADGTIFVGNSTNQATAVTLSGDVTITNTGTATIANNAVTNAKIANSSVTNAKLDKSNIPLSGFGAAMADVNLGAKKLTNVADPINAQDAATKMYIDNIKNQLQSQISNLQNFLLSSNSVTKEALLSLYDIFSLSGPNGEASSHVPNVDPGSGSFIRNLINLQDVSSDVAKTRWINDPGLLQLTTTSGWNANNPHFASFYLRMYYAVQNCNSFLKLLNGSNAPNTILLQSETRFIRALAYYYIIDGFGKGPLITELSPENTATIQESTRIELFNFVESELLSIQNNMPYGNEYGRANRNALRILLAKLYLNAEVYTGTAKYSEALTFINQIFNSGANLADNYLKNFSGDNHTSSEIIFPLIADAVTRQSWGNSTFIIASSNSMGQLGIFGGWQGNRGTKAWYGLFGNSATALAASPDVRAQLFTTAGHNYEMTIFDNWNDGFPSIKFRNTNFSGTTTTTTFANTDFPLFRYADVYLMYAECVLRGASGGNMTDALSYVNQVRNRSNATSISESALTLSFILDERARELNFEGHRRTDLIRFGNFTGNSYLWPWKGGVLNGTSIPDNYKLFPIPLTALQANSNLTQNPGY